ncbi:von Willebrand factor A domain-containing protein 5B2 isoform X1 [Nannospalax galili]|uniref:von Willebrand factor A domain-containing protein 5B2 isoform X1 n=1 Tax=Nannospalax galili TaxID=1026970 RepID=UPI0004ED2B93|nr:von Willebrand factor A domain-containing protein 5B2 isoform X1 [Nannospalax galili]XP_008829495.1 von Willebrand factor A domain-containing protein 5B2 isoform X1 [Nannospalax galili]XP_008829496.1 von Willebrand factor A domain-containing protein 5B2 isoform X1 [Nannospalax galili]XP_008829497.1 von Willebrand factor A domain-containing protein 5B2 isoform X1 [Nannospalax galili]
MPGLYCPSSWTPLPLTDSWVRAYANGPCLSLRARLTYRNPQPQPVDGVFVYPLAEAEVVSGFEAEAAGRRVSFQLQSRRRSQAACCRALGPGLGTSRPRRCAQGHLVLDLAQARSTLVLPTGLVAAAGTMTVTLCSSRELPSRPDGVMHVALPTVFTPLAQPGPTGAPRPPGLCDDRLGLCPTSCFGVSSPEEEGLAWEQPTASPDVFSGPAHCPAPYTFSFEMLVTGPCLLAGLESPSHALRADALPHASSAATICVTLAEGHPCDRALEILLHPSEPHQPHLMLEAGSLSSAEYEAQMRARRDFQRLQQRDSDGERQVWFLQRRFHKDILLNPVLVLSFCPDLRSQPRHLGAATRELLFLLDGSSAVHKDAIILAVKSLPAQTLVNLALFGTLVQPLFPESRPCSDDTVQLICENIENLQAVSSSLDILAVLDWALGQPQHKAHPRQLFLITAASPMAATTHQALEFMRWHRGAARCFSFGLGPACHQLLHGLSVLSRGQAYFLRPGERLQPKLVQALRKALEPALSDISVDWFVPDAVEALLTPREIPALYPGDQLLGYCSLFRVDGFQPRSLRGQEPSWQSLGGSVFPSPEEAPSVTSPGTEPTHTTEPLGTGTVSAELSSPWAAGDSEQSTDALTDPVTDPGLNPSSDTAIWRRIFQSSYIREQYVLTHCSASPEPGPGSTCSSESPGSQGPGSSDGSLPLDPPSQQGCRSLAWVEPAGSRSCPLPVPPPSPFKVGALSAEVLGRQHRAALAGRSLSSPLGRANPVPGRPRHPSLDVVPDGSGPEPGQQLGQGLDDSGSLLSPAPLDWDMLMEPSFLFKAVPPNGETVPPAEPLPPQAPRCHVVIRALCGDQPMCWEVGVELEELWGPRDGLQPPSPPLREAAWDQAFHRLTAASVVRDNERLALRGGAETTTDQGHIRRSWLRALQTSKVSSAPSCFTCPVAVDAATREVLPGALQVWISEPAELSGTYASQGHLVAASLPKAVHSKGSSAGAWDLDLNDNSKSAFWESTSTGGPDHLPLQPPASPRLSLGGVHHHRLYSPNKGQASEGNSKGSNHDYLPLVRLQEAPGSFRLDEPFCAAVCIPQERLCRASPFAAHRASLSPTSASSPWALLGPSTGQGDSATASCSPSPSSGSEGPGQVDSGRGSDTEASDGVEGQGGSGSDLRGRTWATAVALAWLEHRCAAAFGEWELTASKADCWLRAQRLPDGLDLVALKAAAQGLFLLLRHWDQNLQLHLLCYNPSSV